MSINWHLRKGDTFRKDTIVWIETKEKLLDFIKVLDSVEEVTFDTETTGLEEHAVTGGPLNGGIAARAVMATFTIDTWPGAQVEPVTYVLPLSHPHSPFLGHWRTIYTAVAQHLVGKKLIAHHAKFDSRYTLALTGVDLAPYLHWDTMISAYILDEAGKHALKSVAPARFGIESWKDVDLSTPGAAERIPYHQLGIYAARDTYWTYRLYRADKVMLWLESEDDEMPQTEEDWQAYALGRLSQRAAMASTRTLAEMEQRGFGIDLESTQKQLQDLLSRKAELEPYFQNRYPENEYLTSTPFSLAPTSKWFKEFAAQAILAEDLRAIAWTKSKNIQWDKRVLKRLARDGYEVAERILEYRDVAKQSEFLTSWLDKAYKGRIHSTYNNTKVVTGRLSSASPNMQQVSKKLKPAFIPSEGYYLAEIDYSQIELRVAAHIARETHMIEAFNQGHDLHRMFGARLTRKTDLSEVTKEERQKAKSANFGLLYGMSAEGFQIYAETAYGVDVDLSEAERIRNEFFEMWSELSNWHASYIAYARQYGFVVSPLGRMRRIPDIHSQVSKFRSDAERQAINAPVQGMASDIMQLAASMIAGHVPGHRVPEARLVGTVHDSIVVEVPQSSWQETTQACLDVMTKDAPKYLEKYLNCKLTVPLAAEAEVGTRWGLSDIGELGNDGLD